jgi:hypothetical protein
MLSTAEEVEPPTDADGNGEGRIVNSEISPFTLHPSLTPTGMGKTIYNQESTIRNHQSTMKLQIRPNRVAE